MTDWFDAALRGDDCAEAARRHDWSSTPLGDPAGWPPALRRAVELCFSTRFAVLVTWGPELTMIYNDGYRRMLGTDLHPRAMGSPARELWGHIWHEIGPLFEHVMRTGEPTWDVDMLLWMERSGYLEETHFTFSYSALRDDDGTVAGVIDIAHETTDQVVDRRRLALLGRLSTALHGHRDRADDVTRIALEVLDGSEDVTAFALYRGDELVAGTGLPPREAARAVARVARAGTPVWSGEVLAAPVDDSPGDGGVRETLVLHGNPHLPADESQRLFLTVLASTVRTALSAGVEHRRQMARARTVSDVLQYAMVPATPRSPRWETRYRPADDTMFVGGDWFDVVELPEDRFGLVVGDCVGHGVDAASHMGRLSSAGRALMLAGSGPGRTLDQLDDFAASVPGAEFTTVFCGTVDQKRSTLTYSSAGHLPGLVVHADRPPSWLDEARGTPLTLPRTPRPERTVDLVPGDTVLLYTDGLVERRGEHLADGLDRLARVAREACRAEALAEVPDRLFRAMLPDGSRDDVAIVVYRAD